MASYRAMATTPTLRLRASFSANRARYQAASALVGQWSIQGHAISTGRVQAGSFPARLMPCSRCMSPLAYGVASEIATLNTLAR